MSSTTDKKAHDSNQSKLAGIFQKFEQYAKLETELDQELFSSQVF